MLLALNITIAIPAVLEFVFYINVFAILEIV